MKLVISKYLPQRNFVPIKNKYYLLHDNNNFHYVLYFVTHNKVKIIIRNLKSETGWNQNLYIKIFDTVDEELIIIPKHGKNSLITYITLNVVKLEPVEFKEQKIPKRIIQTFWSDYAQSLLHYNTILSLIELNPEYEYVFYNDQMCRDLIKNNFPKNVLIAYDTLTSGSFKSDIFRACYLYLYGGCYFDCKLINKTPIREFIDPNDEVILCEDRVFYSHKGYYNAIIFSISKKDILLNGINRTVNNILNKSYKFSDIFGPHVLYDVAINQNVNIKFKFIFPKVIEIKTNKILVSGFNNDYYKKYKDSGYINLWKEKNLYYDIIYLDNYLIKIYPTNHKFIFYK